MKGLNFFQFIGIFLGIFIPGCFIANLFAPRKRNGELKDASGFIKAGALGLAGALSAWVVPIIARATLDKTWCVIFSGAILALIILAFFVLAASWNEEGSKIGELICAIALVIMFTILGKQAAHAVCVAIPSAFWQSFVLWNVTVATIATTGYIIWNFCNFRSSRAENGGVRTGWNIAAIIAMVATVILLVISLFGIDWKAIKFQKIDKKELKVEAETHSEDEFPVEIPDTVEDPEEDGNTYHYGFFNPILQEDKDEENDFNFGPNPYEIVEPEDIPKDAKWMDTVFRYRISQDPALLAADAGYADSIVGTRYIGVFYDTAKQDWSQAINDAKVAWMQDKMLYFYSIDAFNAFLDSAYKVQIEESDGQETDLMYMNPYTIDGVPDVIVMKTTPHKGHYLVYYFKIKDQEFRVAYRIECGFQPANVSERMHIAPVPQPQKKDDPNPPSDPPKPTPPPSYNKDKTKGTQGELVAPNDDPGPGPNTNNSVGAKESKAEEKPNSTEVKTYQEYKEQQKELKEINQNQKTGTEPAAPTTPTTPKTNVDDNQDKLPKNSEVPVATDAETGKAITTKPAGAWGGPKD